MKRLSARQYAKHLGVHPETVQSWCRNSMLPERERNAALPPVICRKIGRKYQIAVERTELAMSLLCGNPAEKSLARAGSL